MSTNDPTFGNPDNYPQNPFASPQAVDDPSQIAPARTGELTLNPWLSIWTRPRETIRQIVDSDPRHRFWLIAMLYGVNVMLGQSGQVANGFLPLAVYLLLVAVVGPPLGVVMLYLFSWAIGLCGRLFSGYAPADETRAAVAWSCVPWITLMPVSIVMAVHTIVNGPIVDPYELLSDPLSLFSILLGFAAWGWSIVISANTLAEVNQFAWWKGFLACVFSFVFWMVVVFVFSFIAIAIAVGGFGIGVLNQ